MRSMVVPIAAVALLGCEQHVSRPPPDLPEPPAPYPQGYLQTEEAAPAPIDPSLPPRPAPTGDREADALSLGFWGCRVMGVRLTPTMSGRAWLRATLGPGGDVVDAVAERVESLPRPVVQCLLDRLARARFDPRGGDGSILTIPVDFTRVEPRTTLPTATSSPSQSL